MNASHSPDDIHFMQESTDPQQYDSLAGLDFRPSSNSNPQPSNNLSDKSTAAATAAAAAGPTVSIPASSSASINTLANSLKDVDIHTHTLLANLLAATSKPMASLDDIDGEEMDESKDLALLMKEMDNTYDALGELESRAEDILGKLDAFLHESGFEGEVDLDGDGSDVEAGDKEEEEGEQMDTTK